MSTGYSVFCWVPCLKVREFYRFYLIIVSGMPLFFLNKAHSHGYFQKIFAILSSFYRRCNSYIFNRPD